MGRKATGPVKGIAGLLSGAKPFFADASASISEADFLFNAARSFLKLQSGKQKNSVGGEVIFAR